MLSLSILFDRDGAIRVQPSFAQPDKNCPAPIIWRPKLTPHDIVTYYHIGTAGMYELYEEA